MLNALIKRLVHETRCGDQLALDQSQIALTSNQAHPR